MNYLSLRKSCLIFVGLIASLSASASDIISVTEKVGFRSIQYSVVSESLNLQLNTSITTSGVISYGDPKAPLLEFNRVGSLIEIFDLTGSPLGGIDRVTLAPLPGEPKQLFSYESYRSNTLGAVEEVKGGKTPVLNLYSQDRSLLAEVISLGDRKWEINVADSNVLPTYVPLTILMLKSLDLTLDRRWKWTRNIGLTAVAAAGAGLIYKSATQKSPRAAPSGGGSGSGGPGVSSNQSGGSPNPFPYSGRSYGSAYRAPVPPPPPPSQSFFSSFSGSNRPGNPAFTPNTRPKPSSEFEEDFEDFHPRHTNMAGLMAWESKETDTDEILPSFDARRRGDEEYGFDRLDKELSGLKTIEYTKPVVVKTDNPDAVTKEVVLNFPLKQVPLEILTNLSLKKSDSIRVRMHFTEQGGFFTGLDAKALDAGGMTDSLDVSIHRYFSNFRAVNGFANQNFILSFADFLKLRIINPTQFCPYCEAQFHKPQKKIVPCKKDACKTAFADSGHGVNLGREVKQKGEVTDLLLSFAKITAAWANDPRTQRARAESVFDPFPSRFMKDDGRGGKVKDFARFLNVINKIPSLKDFQGNSETAEEFNKKIRLVEDAPYLMQWILASNRANLKPVDLSSPKKELGRLWDNRIMYAFEVETTPEKQLAFETLKKAAPDQNKPTRLLFHGSQLENFSSLLKHGVKNLSGTVGQVNGATYGSGIYLGWDFRTSAGYSMTGFVNGSYKPWPADSLYSKPLQTQWGSASSYGRPAGVQYAMLVTEIVTDANCTDAGWCTVGKDENGVILRYVFLF